MQTTDLSDAVVARLASLGPGGPPVLSLYLDLDPSTVPTPRERSAELSALLDRLTKDALGEAAGFSRDERAALRGDIERLRGLLDGDDGVTKGAHGLAVFCSGAAGLLEVLRLPHQVEPAASVERSPRLLPLLAQLAADRWGVVLVSRRAARILRGDRDRLVEVADFRDDVHRRHQQGGWSQARYQRGIVKEVHDHSKRAAAALLAESKRRPLDHLVVGCSDELWPELQADLHPYLRERVRGRIELDVERSTPDQVLDEVAAVIAATEEGREREALERLGTGLGQSGHGAAGLDEVLVALDEHRVSLLLLAPGARFSGAACPRCGWLSASAGSCPMDDSPLEQTEALAERAAQAALRDGAELLLVRHRGGELAERGSIGALLRY